MAYLDLLSNEIAETQYLVVLRPRRRATGFSLHAGSVYVAAFDYGEVSKAWDNAVPLVQGSSATLSAGQFWHDLESNQLYVRLSGGGDPNSIWLVAGFEVYVTGAGGGTHFNRIPTDEATRVVYFEPFIKRSPVFKVSSSDSEYGFNPVQTSSMELANAEHTFDRFIHDSSFNRIDCEVYYWLEKLKTENVKRVLRGLVTEVNYDPSSISLRIVDRNDDLSSEWRHPSGQKSFYDLAIFPELDPELVAKPVRKVYGFIKDGFIPANIDHLDEDPTEMDNRTFVVTTGQTGLEDVVKTVLASPSSTTTRTYLDSVTGLNVGDTFKLDKTTDESGEIEEIGANYIDHTAIATPATGGDTLHRAFVSRITIAQNDAKYTALYGRDYTVTQALPGGTSGFILSEDLEINLSMAEVFKPSDQIYCRVYGQANNLTLGGPVFGGNDARTLNMAHPAQFILDVLKNHLGESEAEIDQDSFAAALTDQSSGIGIVIPETASSESFPKYRDALGRVTKSALAKLLIDQDGKWSISTKKPLGSVDFEVDDDEIARNSVKWEYSNDDIVSDIIVEYGVQETSFEKPSQDLISRAYSKSESGSMLHLASSSETERSVWAFDTEAQQLADRLSYILGERRGRMTFKAKNRFYEVKLGNNVAVTRIYMPGFNVDGKAQFTRAHAVIEADKGRDQVTITLDDQKGIEDNQGVW